ncbi:MAG: hypothetical protein EON55_12665 [Alphaproteobacteria bacterium]|nr:MAG: hypothetical protein EON55_12665 [Alphaproteobacteria bacterium]
MSAIGIAHERAVIGQALDEAEHAKPFLEDPLVRPQLLEWGVVPELALADQWSDYEGVARPKPFEVLLELDRGRDVREDDRL